MTGAIRVTAAVIWQDGRVLLGRRPAGGRDGGRWEFPGGKIEAAETPEAALARELEEELGITARVGELLDETMVSTEGGGPPIQLAFFAVEISSGRPAARHHQALRWVHPADLDALDLLPGDRPFARRLAQAGLAPTPPSPETSSGEVS